MNKSIELFAQEKPMYYARGNHETRGVFATSFQNYFSVKEPHLYFTLRQGYNREPLFNPWLRDIKNSSLFSQTMRSRLC